MVADSDSLPAKRVDFSDREYFTVHRNNPDVGLFISAPIVSRTVGKPFIAMSRRLEKRAGGFDGVIVAALDTEYVQRLYSDLNVGKEGSVALFLRNGTLLVRAPHVGSEVWFAQLPQLRTDAVRHSPMGTLMDAYRLQVKELETLREIARQAKHELRLTMEFLERRQIDRRAGEKVMVRPLGLEPRTL